MGTCYVIGAGECGRIEIEKHADDFIICADGGLASAEKNGICPDLAVGDFDSLGFVPNGVETVVHPAEKDETDTHLALNVGLERGYKSFVMYGMLGGRLDHTFANLQLLSYLCENGARGKIYGTDFSACAVKNGSLSFPRRKSGMLSVFSLTEESRGVEISGLKYEVSGFMLRSSCPMGVSNEFADRESKISVSDGTLLVIWEN